MSQIFPKHAHLPLISAPLLLSSPCKQETGNNQVIFMQLDLASLKSVRSFAERFLQSESRLDLLINNAGEPYDIGALQLILSVCFVKKSFSTFGGQNKNKYV